jgi:hypothetical protein
LVPILEKSEAKKWDARNNSGRHRKQPQKALKAPFLLEREKCGEKDHCVS